MQNKTRQLIILILYLILFEKNINSNVAVQNEILSSKSGHLYEALSLIIQEEFLDTTMKLIFFVNFHNYSTEYYHQANDLIDDVLQNISTNIFKYNIFYNKRKRFHDIKSNEVILLDSIETFGHFFANLRITGNQDVSRILLFISSLKSAQYEVIYSIFKDLYYMDILRVSLVVELANGTIVMYTYFPFTHNACRDFEPVIINRYLADEHRWENTNYIPDKLDDFYGCPIYCCTWREMPYFAVNTNNKNAIYNYIGLDASLLQHIAASHNFSLKIRWIEPITSEVHKRDTSMQKLFKEKCDLVVGGFTYRNDLDMTSTFSQTKYLWFSHIFVITNVMTSNTSYEKLAFPFHYKVWLALGLTFAMSFLVICTCDRQRQWSAYRNFLFGSANSTPLFHLYALAVGGTMTQTHMPKRNFARFLIICWLLLTFILRTAYQSGMYKILRDNKQWNTPQTVADLYKQKYLIGVIPKTYNYLKVLPDTKRVRVFNTTVLEVFSQMLEAKEPIALIVPYEYFGYFGLKNLSEWKQLHIIPERLLVRQLTVYVRHNSYLIPVINAKLSYSRVHGFVARWSRAYVVPIADALKYAKKPRRNIIGNANKNPLLMSELGAIFVILAWVYIFAAAVFLMELFYQRCVTDVKIV